MDPLSVAIVVNKKQPQVKYCVKCGLEIGLDDKWCGYCGAEHPSESTVLSTLQN